MVSLPKQQSKKALWVPRDASVLRSNEAYVLSVDEQELAHKIIVNIGQGDGDWIPVTEELSLDDKVIIRGGERLQDGQKVRLDKGLIAKLP